MTAEAAPAASLAVWYESVPELEAIGARALTTTRSAGSFALASDEPVRDVMARWDRLREHLAPFGPRLATARQVHGDRVVSHSSGWEGWLRTGNADGHLALERGTAMGVSIADCVPVFLAHPSGAAGILHSGWRGTSARIVERALDLFEARGIPSAELVMHLGPAICGKCYEVSPDVYERLTARSVGRATTVDLRALIADHARLRGLRRISVSESCTRCHNDRFFSHRSGDSGRQVGVIIVPM